MENLVKNRVSLIIPIYNGEKYIERSLKSVINQTYSNIQLILINDGSNDDTDRLIQAELPNLKKILSDVKYLKKTNGGVGSALNEGLKYFDGEFLLLLDVDDILLKESIEILVDKMNENPDCSYVYGNGYYVKENNLDDISSPFYDSTYNGEKYNIFDLVLKGKVKTWAGSYMIRTSTWLQNNKGRDIFPSRYGQNMQLVLPTVYKSKGLYLDKPLMKYIRHDGSITTTFSEDEDNYEVEKVRYNGYEEIYLNVINKLDITDKEKYIKYIKYIRYNFLRSKMYLAIWYNHKEGKQFFEELNRNHELSINDKIAFYKKNNYLLYVYYRLARKLRVMK